MKINWIILTAIFTLAATQIQETKAKKDPKMISEKSTDNSSWKDFKTKYQKNFRNPNEDVFRGFKFEKNKKKINQHNAKAKSSRTWNMQINEFADMPDREFQTIYTALLVPNKEIRQTSNLLKEKNKLEKQNCQCNEKNIIQKNKTDKELEKKLPNVKKLIKAEYDKKREVKEQFKQKSENFLNMLEDLTPEEQEIVQGVIQGIYGSQGQSNGQLRKIEETPIQNSGNNGNGNSNGNGNGNGKKLKRLLTQDFNVDWTSWTGKIRHQGICGICYAIAPIQNVQFLVAKYVLGFNIQLSVQQILDCDLGFSLGCSGGYLQGPFNFLQTRGVQTNFAYPYTSGDTGVADVCKDSTDGQFKIESYSTLPEGDCLSLNQALLTKPVTVAITGTQLQFYSEGIFDGCRQNLNHAVLLIGYQSTVGWKIKNSWGASWGDEGYAYISEANNCRICDLAVVPNIKQEPSENKNNSGQSRASFTFLTQQFLTSRDGL